MLERCSGWNAGGVNAAQIRKIAGDFRETSPQSPVVAPRRVSGKRRGIARSRHTWRFFPNGNGNCLCRGIADTPRSRQERPLMLDVLIERVSYEPMAIFVIVAVVLLIMLARTVT